MRSTNILFLILLLFNVLDCVTGFVKARYKGKENSKSGARGIVNKLGMWFVIFVSFTLSFAFCLLGKLLFIDLGYITFIGWLVLILFIINEVRSILENLIESGVKVPKILSKGLTVYEKKIEGMVE